MDITVQTLTGTRERLELKVYRWDTIDSVKKKIQGMQRIAPERQRLYLAGKQLEDGHSLAQYDIQHGSNLVLVHNLVDQFDTEFPNQSARASSSSSAMPATAYHEGGADPGDEYDSVSHTAATNRSAGAPPEGRNLWHEIAMMERRAAASIHLKHLSEEHHRELSRPERASHQEGAIQTAAALEAEQVRTGNSFRAGLDACAEQAGLLAPTSELEKCHRNIVRLSSEVTELKNYKQESEVKLTTFGHVIEQLKEELVVVRNEYRLRDQEQAAELAGLKEDKKKYKDARNALREKLEEEMQKTLCQIFFNRPRDSLIFPCSHLQYCFQCLQQHQERQKTCPTCRSSISSVLKCNVSIS